MNERKATKRALLTSITALVMCVVMLAGTTFAWFTDTASTNVNKIQAGKLDVALEMYDTTQSRWVNAEGKTLNWVKATTGSGQATLWEPGAEYKLPELKVVNNGNLALKYEIAITGAVDADGRNDLDSMKLLNVLKFKSVVGSDTKENVYGQPIATGTLETNGAEQIIKLSAKMDENAGNGYMNMALSNITVTVKAMQASFEHDSNGNTYDQDANGNPDNPTWSVSAHVTANVATGDTVLRNADGTVELTAPAGSTGATSLTLKVEPKTAVDSNITVNAGQTAQPYEISLVDESNRSVTAGNGEVFTVKLYVGKGLNSNHVKVYHNSTEVTGAQYDSNSGYVTFTTDSFSPFTVVFDTPVAIVGDTYYNTLSDAVAAAKDGDTITLVRDANGDGITVQGGKVFTLDFGGHSYTVDGKPTGSKDTESQAFQLLTGSTIVFKNGKIIGDTPGVQMLIQNYCNLTLDNMTLDATVGNNNVSYSMSNNCGIVTIKDTTITAKADGVAFDVYGGFGSYGDVTVTVDGNSVINGNIELARATGSSNINKNTLVLKNCTVNGNILKSDGTLNFEGNVTLNGDVNVTDITDAVANRTTVTEKTTLNLNGKIITPEDMGKNTKNFTALIVDEDTTINAGVNGGIDTQKNGAYGIVVRRGAKLTINGGTYYGGGTAVQVQEGTLVINGGTFEVEPYSDPTYGYKYLINCIDAAWKNGTAKIAIKGGTFVNFDPANSASENPNGNFVAEGYKVVSETQANGDVWYTVVSN